MTLSLTDMANRVQLTTPAEAERYVLHMVSRFFFPDVRQPRVYSASYAALVYSLPNAAIF